MVQHSAQERYAYTYGGVHAVVHGPRTFLPSAAILWTLWFNVETDSL